MYTGLKGVQVEIRWGRRSHRREFRQAKIRLGVGKKQTNHNIKELGEKTSQFTGGKQGKTIIKINRKWNEDGIQRQNRGGQSQENPSNSRKMCTHENV